MRTLIAILVMSILLFASCKKDNKTTEKSGYFILKELRGDALTKSINRSQYLSDDTIVTSFSLGELKASKEFYFILMNGGANPITDVEISSNNPAFQVSPDKISSLAGDESSSTEFVTLISLSVIHGIRLNGVGYTSLLPMGENTAVITIIGNTIENGETIQLKSTFSFTVDAKVMDAQIYDDGVAVDMLNPSAIDPGREFMVTSLRYYYYKSYHFKIKNIGNVPLNIKQFDWTGLIWNPVTNFVLEPNTEKSITLVNVEMECSAFELDGDGTISDYNRILQGDNGKGYFALTTAYASKKSFSFNK